MANRRLKCSSSVSNSVFDSKTRPALFAPILRMAGDGFGHIVDPQLDLDLSFCRHRSTIAKYNRHLV